MFKQATIEKFVSHSSGDQCAKLYAALLMSKDRTLSRKDALWQARFESNRDDLVSALSDVFDYGPDDL